MAVLYERCEYSGNAFPSGANFKEDRELNNCKNNQRPITHENSPNIGFAFGKTSLIQNCRLGENDNHSFHNLPLFNKNFVIILMLVIASFSGISYCHAIPYKNINIEGEWRFGIDREDIGVEQQWYNTPLKEQITLPGILQSQGYGNKISTDTPWVLSLYDKYWYLRKDFKQFAKKDNVKFPFLSQPKRHYLGAAWYQRDIVIPENWKHRRVMLHLERAHWKTTVWIDKEEVGSQNSLVAPHIYEFGQLAPGKHQLTIRVDNRMQMDYRPDAHSVSDALGNTWNGIVGDIKLVSTSKVWLKDIQAYGDIDDKSVTLKIEIGNLTGKIGKGVIEVNELKVPVEWTEQGTEKQIKVELGNDAGLWDEFNPVLHHITVKLTGDNADDSKDVTFGLRKISTDGYSLLVNGRKSCFRGTHSGGDFPLTGYPATDKVYWKKLFTTCKEWGLNHVRFHSYCPPDAAFTAADEVGIYLQPEAGMWNVISPGTDMEKMMYEETDRMIRAYGNHPSFVLMSPSNEPKGHWQDSLPKWVEHYRKVDPRRLYTTGTGWPIVAEPGHVEEADFLAVHRLGGRVPGVGPQTFGHRIVNNPLRGSKAWFGGNYQSSVEGIDVPVIVHELGQWCAYPDFDIIEKFTGYMTPSNYVVFQKLMNDAGLSDMDKPFSMASGKFQALCYKEEIEANLRTKDLSGFQLLDLHDYLGQGTALVGMLDAFWQEKGYINAKQWRRFCNTTVPLALLYKRVYTTNEDLNVDVVISHYGKEPIRNAKVYCKLLDTQNNVVKEGGWDVDTIPLGSASPLGNVFLDLSEVKSPGKYKLVVGLDGTEFVNDWNIWVYPEPKTQEQNKEVFVTHSFDEAIKALNESKNVLLTPEYHQLAWQSPPIGRLPIFWNRLMGPNWERFLGIVCNPEHPALEEFPTEYHYDWQWRDLFGRYCRAINISGLPDDIKPIVQVIDDWARNYKLAALFECKVGSGKLVVCAANLEYELDNRPVAAQFRKSLVDYMNSTKFNPKAKLKTEELLSLRFDNQIMNKLKAKAYAKNEDGYVDIGRAIDGNPNSYWTTAWTGATSKHPYELFIDFDDEVHQADGLVVMARQDHREHLGDIREYCIEQSVDGENWKIVTKGSLESTFNPQEIKFGKTISTKHLKLTALSGFGNDNSMSLAEIAILYSGKQLDQTDNQTQGYKKVSSSTEEMYEGNDETEEESIPENSFAPKPLYRDPIYDGAADPVVIWNKAEKKWFMFYTNRRANDDSIKGVAWVHGTPIGIAESSDNGVTWTYRQDANIEYKKGEGTYWAPEVMEHDGTYHMYLTYVPGIFNDWKHPRSIIHLTSKNLLDWEYQATLELACDKVIDACVMRMDDGSWRMWYNNERDGKSIYYADSDDLYHWQDKGKAVASRGEGPKVFRWKDYIWMVVDTWRGLGVYRSTDGLKWEHQPYNLLAEPGTGEDDKVKGGHADVVINDGKAYLFYFTHPGRQGPDANKDTSEQRRSSIQVVQIELEDGWFKCDRNKPTWIYLKQPRD